MRFPTVNPPRPREPINQRTLGVPELLRLPLFEGISELNPATRETKMIERAVNRFVTLVRKDPLNRPKWLVWFKTVLSFIASQTLRPAVSPEQAFRSLRREVATALGESVKAEFKGYKAAKSHAKIQKRENDLAKHPRPQSG